MSWDPKVYLDFEDERTRPAAELLARVPQKSPEHVIDLGCGPGNSTALLARRWPKSKLEGLDSSEAMLDQARRSAIRATWHSGDIPSWKPAKRYDVIYANAALHWLDKQDELLRRLMSYLEPKGVLAFQVPVNFNEPSHRLMREVAAEGPWAARLKNVRNMVLGTAEGYYDVLEPLTAALDIWQTTYLQVLTGDDAVYRWVSGTGLRPFLNALEGSEREAYVREYKSRLAAAYPARASAKTLFPFQRLFVVATR
ncbi:MAG: trans-aconitate 2-methyltransferase [Alphaproteobacteria bacterium]|nr:trans-aconitate 2-methyltransferase [Alphaproteobacteria bacterium]MBV9692562.1 trans-aconitate 2-methyltransferase [Alphaproteobacteria bacterium]